MRRHARLTTADPPVEIAEKINLIAHINLSKDIGVKQRILKPSRHNL